jgi:hypothetical protein
VLERFDEAGDFYRRAAAFSEKAGMKSFVADADLAWGSMLLERNAPRDAEQARVLLTKAHAAATAHGYGRIERLAAQALADLD